VLSRLFRGKFLALLHEAYRQGQLRFHGAQAGWAEPSEFGRLSKQLKKSDWVVYSKPPFGGPEQVLTYLSRYTHGVAISNSRLLSLQDGQVSFQWRDYRDGQTKVMTLSAVEFLRRFLQHILPASFVKIRHFGFLANRCRRDQLARCLQLLSCTQVTLSESQPGRTNHLCPVCGTGILRIVEWLAAVSVLEAAWLPQPVSLDSS
jgi:putative transposase